jgi:hypothetical protein
MLWLQSADLSPFNDEWVQCQHCGWNRDAPPSIGEHDARGGEFFHASAPGPRFDAVSHAYLPTATLTPRIILAHSSSSDLVAFQPQIPQETIRDIGGVFTPIVDSNTDGQNILVIISPKTFSFNAYLHSSAVTPSYRGSLVNPITGAFSALIPRNILIAGNILGIRTSTRRFQRISNICWWLWLKYSTNL